MDDHDRAFLVIPCVLLGIAAVITLVWVGLESSWTDALHWMVAGVITLCLGAAFLLLIAGAD